MEYYSWQIFIRGFPPSKIAFHLSDSYLVSPELLTMSRVRVFVLYWREILLTGWEINELVFLIHMLYFSSDLSHIRWDPIWAKHCGTRRLAGLSFFGIPNTVSLLNPTTNFAEWGVAFVFCLLYFAEWGVLFVELQLWKPQLARLFWGGMAYSWSLKQSFHFQDVFFNDVSFGNKRSNFLDSVEQGCDYCFWMIHYRSLANAPSNV